LAGFQRSGRRSWYAILARWQIVAERWPISARQIVSLRLRMHSSQLRTWLAAGFFAKSAATGFVPAWATSSERLHQELTVGPSTKPAPSPPR
jgi:hypothetical protein